MWTVIRLIHSFKTITEFSGLSYHIHPFDDCLWRLVQNYDLLKAEIIYLQSETVAVIRNRPVGANATTVENSILRATFRIFAARTAGAHQI